MHTREEVPQRLEILLHAQTNTENVVNDTFDQLNVWRMPIKPRNKLWSRIMGQQRHVIEEKENT